MGKSKVEDDIMKGIVIKRIVELHVDIYFSLKGLKTEEELQERYKKIVQYDLLKELVRENTVWDQEEISKEIEYEVTRRTPW